LRCNSRLIVDGAAQLGCDRPHPQALPPQGGDPLPFQ
jgi:hypothetical protein